jgi:hypothetical protein
MTQAVIPQCCTRRAGLIVSLTSATLVPTPLAIACVASKRAVKDFTVPLDELGYFVIASSWWTLPWVTRRFAQEVRVEDIIPGACRAFAGRMVAARTVNGTLTWSLGLRERLRPLLK